MPRLVIDGVEYQTLLAAPLQILAEHLPGFIPGNVLSSYAQAVEETRRRLAADRGRELPREWTFLRWLEHLGLPDPSLARTLASALMDATLRAAAPSADLLPLLGTLRDRGISLGLISNLADADGGRLLLKHLELDRYFDVMIFSGDLGRRKPDSRIYLHAAHRLGQLPENLLHIGDEWEADITGACNAGFTALWVGNDKSGYNDTAALNAPICRFSEFADFVLTE